MNNSQLKKPASRHIGSLIIGVFIVGNCILTVFLFINSLYTYRYPFKHLTITQIDETCVSGYDTKVEDVQWTGKKELTCIVAFEGWCERRGLHGDYKIDGDNLILDYDYIFGSSSGCICKYELRYRIGNLERKEYQVTIGNIE